MGVVFANMVPGSVFQRKVQCKQTTSRGTMCQARYFPAVPMPSAKVVGMLIGLMGIVGSRF